MSKLPEHIVDSIESKNTSLGDNPALPKGNNFLKKIVTSYFDHISGNFNEANVNSSVKELNDLVLKCREEERKCRPALEKLCSEIVSDMFRIPEDTIKIEINLTDTVDSTNYRMLPEEDDGFSFDDIRDMDSIGAEIQKRRMLNALIEGASEVVSYDVVEYVQKLFEINPALPELYSKIIELSQFLMYSMDETELRDDSGNGGTVKVIMKSAPDMLEIKVDATLFPVLLQETIKGILEVAILQGLPDNKDKAYYVMKKSDFKLAEVWDSRLGVPLWKRIEGMIPEDTDMDAVGLNFFFMELSMLPTETFNEAMQEIFAGTRKGKEIVSNICEKILTDKDEEDFNDYIAKNNELYPIEDGFFTEEELPGERPEWY
jgi:hypothetical protein